MAIDPNVFRDTLTLAFQMELVKVRSGQRKWNVSNQFDESVLEGAIEAIKQDETLAELIERGGEKWDTMNIAYTISNFQAPEIDSCWID